VSALAEPRANSADDRPAVATRGSEVAASDAPELAAESVDAALDPEDASPAELAARAAVQVEPDPPPGNLRLDFGAHFETHYQRLVAQLYAITLDAGLAHDAVQDAYARAWRRWTTVSRTADPTAWVRSVAVRSTIRSWRSLLGRFGTRRPRADRDNIEPRVRALLSALHLLPAPERRALVLAYMAGSSIAEIAAIEQVSINTVQARLSRGRRLISENLADDLPALLGREVAR
jgi:RNA polymerase sigma factor (sigma-70 family)